MKYVKYILNSILLLMVMAGQLSAQPQETQISVFADQEGHRLSRYLTGACIEDVNHEIYGGLYSQMIFGESFQEPPLATPLAGSEFEVSGMWRVVQRGGAKGAFALERTHPFVGQQSQMLTFTEGQGEIGLENQGLNRWGMNFVAGKNYEGLLWVKAERDTDLWMALESADGDKVYAEQTSRVKFGDWKRLSFSLTPKVNVVKGRFVIKLKKAGELTLGYAALQPGDWGRYKGLPVRKDVAEAMIDQVITLLRYGGSMINHPEYRWKKMVGPRDRRQPSRGTWYAHSSNGWGIPDFMSFSEAIGVEYVPAFNMDESPQDMADFIEYAKGPASTAWGRQRGVDGHAHPYNLRYLQLGNEERVDDAYAAKFEALARAIWAKDRDIILVVGDFVYKQPIVDSSDVKGAESGITNLFGQQRILRLAKQFNREVWFDVHVGTDGPTPDNTFAAMFTYRDALARLADGARFQVVAFEFNAGNHTQRRALANALAILAIERDGRIPVAVSANALQPDGQNDNGWDQGLLFLNPSHVWLQPPGYVTRMMAQNYQPQWLRSEVADPKAGLDVVATRSENGKTLVLQVVNVGEAPVSATLKLNGYKPSWPKATVQELAGPLDARNSADHPTQIAPRSETWTHEFAQGPMKRLFPAHSFTIIRFE